MAGNVEELVIQLQADLSDFRRQMGGMSSEISGVASGGSKSFGMLGTAVAGMGMAVASAAVGVAALSTAITGFGVKYNAELETASVAFGTLLGSAEKADKMIKDLQAFGASTPYEFQGLQEAAKLTLAMGFSAEEVMPMMKSLGDSVSAVGGTEEDLKGVVTALGQMKAKGKVSAEEMNQLAERGIGAWDVMAKATGKTKAELMDMASEGKLMADDVLPKLVDGLGTKYAGAMEAQSKTFNGMMSTMKDNLGMLAAEMAKPAFEFAKKMMEVALPMVDKFSASFKKGGWNQVFKDFLPPGLANGLSEVANAIDFVKSGASALINMLTTGDLTGFTKMGFSTEEAVAINNAVWDIIDGFKAAYAVVGEVVGETAGLIGDMVGAIIEGYKGSTKMQGAFDSLINGAKDLWKTIGSLVEILKVVWGWIDGPVVLALTVMFDRLGTIAKIVGTVAKTLAGLGEVLAGVFTLDGDKIKSGLSKMLKGMIGTLRNLWNLTFFGDEINEAFDKAIDFVKSAAKFFVDAWGKIKSTFSTGASAIASGVVSKFNEIKRTITTIFNLILPIVQNFFNSVKAVFTAGINIAKTIISTGFNLIKTVFATVFLVIVSLLTGKWGEIGGIFNAGMNKAKSLVSTALSSIKTTFSTMFSTVISNVSGSFSYVASLFNTGMTNAKNFVVNGWKNITSSFNTSIENVKGYVSGLFKNLISKFSTGLEDSKKETSKGLDKVAALFTALPEKALKWGKNFIQGFIDGIASMKDAVGKKASSIIEGAKDYIGFNSPSKKGEGRNIVKWGANFVSGFIDGMDSMIPDIAKASDEVFKAMNIQKKASLGLEVSTPNLEQALKSASYTAQATVRQQQEKEMKIELSLKGGIDKLADSIEARVVNRLASSIGGRL